MCDFQELYRHPIDDFLILYCKSLRYNDFKVKNEDMTKMKKGKRVYLASLEVLS